MQSVDHNIYIPTIPVQFAIRALSTGGVFAAELLHQATNSTESACAFAEAGAVSALFEALKKGQVRGIQVKERSFFNAMLNLTASERGAKDLQEDSIQSMLMDKVSGSFSLMANACQTYYFINYR